MSSLNTHNAPQQKLRLYRPNNLNLKRHEQMAYTKLNESSFDRIANTHLACREGSPITSNSRLLAVSLSKSGPTPATRQPLGYKQTRNYNINTHQKMRGFVLNNGQEQFDDPQMDSCGSSGVSSASGGCSGHNLNSGNLQSRFINFFSKRSFRGGLKRTKSVTKLDRRQMSKPEPPITPTFHRSHHNLALPTQLPSTNSFLTPFSTSRLSRSHESLATEDIDPPPMPLAPPPACTCCRNEQIGGSYNTKQAIRKGVQGDEEDEWKYYDFVREPAGGKQMQFGAMKPIVVDKAYESATKEIKGKRTLYTMKMSILEAKGLASKKRFYCDIYLDQTQYGKTSSKTKSQEMGLFWGEQFDFARLPNVQTLEVHLYRESEHKKAKKNKDRHALIGKVVLPIMALSAAQLTEKWYPVILEKNCGIKSDDAAIRIKARYQAVQILPDDYYRSFVDFLRTNYGVLVKHLEPRCAIKTKTDLADCLVRVMHSQGLAARFLSDVVSAEIEGLSDKHCVFRGNTLGSKAVEAFMKLVGSKYLNDCLGDVVRNLVESGEDCEVDPDKLGDGMKLEKQQAALKMLVEMTWSRIINSQRYFPSELRTVFEEMRVKLENIGKGEISDSLLSASIFLRFLCPAILNPNLFGLVREYPNRQVARNLTLIAKTIQTLSNATKFSGKESYMEFMNDFITSNWQSMKMFLQQISNPIQLESLTTCGPESVDLGKELSLLQSLLTSHFEGSADMDFDEPIQNLRTILNELNSNHQKTFLTPDPTSHYSSFLTREVEQRVIQQISGLPTYDPQPSGLQPIRSRTNPTYVSNSNKRVAKDLTTSDDYVLTEAITPDPQVSRTLSSSDQQTDYVELIPLKNQTSSTGSQHSLPDSHHSSGYLSANRNPSSATHSSSHSSSPVENQQTKNFTFTRKPNSSTEESDSEGHARNYLPRTNPHYTNRSRSPKSGEQKFRAKSVGRAESSLLGTSEMRIQNSSDKRRHARHWNENDLPDKRDNKGYLAEVSDLKRQLSELQNKLYEAESKLSSQESVTCRALKAWQTQMDVKEEISKREQDEKDQQMRNIVRRLINVEEELRKEQTELLSMMSTKQKVIEAQEARIQNLDNANARLLAALSQFREQRRTSYACHPAVPVTTVDSPRSQINSNVPSKDGKNLFDIITDIDYIDDRIDSARQTPNDRYYNSASSNDLRTSSC